MENLREILQKLSGRLSGIWNGLNLVKKMLVVGAALTVVLGIVVGISMQRADEYDYLYVNLSSEDVQAITEFLKKSGISDYSVDSKGIKVPQKEVVPYRIKLAQEGLPSKGEVGWEKFDTQDFTRTEFERKIIKLRAIQGELARTIGSIEGISSARVHIVMPQPRLFEKDQKETTAAIYLKTSRGVTLNDRQIKGIVHLVSKSVEGLDAENITIIDQEGKLLTEEKSKDPTSRLTKETLEHKKNVERQLEENVRAIVGRIVGQDRVEAKVDVVIDFTKEEQTISDLDPDKVVVVSQNTTQQNLNGTGLNPTGIPGSKSNVPGEQEQLNLQTAQTNNKRESELINYEIAKTVSHRVLPFGVIKRISAAVIVDGKQAYPRDGSTPQFEARTEEEMKKIEELVKSAIGFVGSRDEVKVHNMLFQLDTAQISNIVAEKTEEWQTLSSLTGAAVLALAILLFFAMVVRPYIRWLSYDPERKREQKVDEEYRPDLAVSTIKNIQVKEDVPFDKLSTQEKVMHIARHEPERTTEAIRMLISPHQSAPK